MSARLRLFGAKLSLWKTGLLGLALIFSGWPTGLADLARAQDSSDFAKLLERVEAIERENADLKRIINGSSSATIESAVPASEQNEAQARRLVDSNFLEISESQNAIANATPVNDLAMSATWNNGLELQTKDKAFRVHVGGRTQLDTAWFSVDDDVQGNINNRYQDGTDFRRARLRIDGTMYEQIEWAAEYDFVNSVRPSGGLGNGANDFDVTALTDMWWAIKELPVVGNIKIGNQKEQIGFEHIVSSRYLPFMERSYNQDTFYGGIYNGFTPGISIYDTYDDEMGTWNIGAYKPVDNVFAVNATNGDYAVTGRATRLLWYENEGADLLHLGFSARQFSTVKDRIRYRTRDAIRTGISVQWPIPADTGTLLGDDGQWLNTEVVGVSDAWTFQSEYLASFLQDASRTPAGRKQDLFYQGGYIQLMYFLTGEHDHYSRKTGVFERVKPHKNFRLMRTDPCNDGWGAWQVGLRYNYLDLNDQGINGGELHNYTAGLNWFLNPNMKLQANYSLTERNSSLPGDAGDGLIHGWGFRLAHDF